MHLADRAGGKPEKSNRLMISPEWTIWEPSLPTEEHVMANLFNAVQAYVAAFARSAASPVPLPASKALSDPDARYTFAAGCVFSGSAASQSLRGSLQAAGHAYRDRGR